MMLCSLILSRSSDLKDYVGIVSMSWHSLSLAPWFVGIFFWTMVCRLSYWLKVWGLVEFLCFFIISHLNLFFSKIHLAWCFCFKGFCCILWDCIFLLVIYSVFLYSLSICCFLFWITIRLLLASCHNFDRVCTDIHNIFSAFWANDLYLLGISTWFIIVYEGLVYLQHLGSFEDAVFLLCK